MKREDFATPRDFAGYGRNLPGIRWPNGQRIAVSFVVNFEEGAELSISGGDTRNEAVYEVIDRLDILDPCIDSHFEYGTRVGYWRIADLFERFGGKFTLSSCGRAVEVSPWLARDAIARGHEVSAHGYRWQSHADLTIEQERTVIRQTLDTIERVTGQAMIDLLILDLKLPGESGMDIARRIRADSNMPIIMLTGCKEEADRVMALELGADDYLTKPFSPRELLARINAVLRRTTPVEGTERIDVEGLVLDQSSQRVSSGERTVALGPTEYRMLAFFMTHPERVYTREQLLDRVWGGNVYVEERTIDVHIRRLRKALEEYGYDRLIQTVRGSGYRFSARPL